MTDPLEEYDPGPLLESDLAADPLEQFRRWHQAARDQAPEPDAMVLATDSEGRPTARAVILRSVDHGFVFYTNYHSPKARQLTANPRAAACMLWAPMRRQVRIEGGVEQVSGAESDAYFATRPRGAQISATISPQSRIVASREELEVTWEEFEQSHPGPIDRPDHWGGYRLVPDMVEFWQGRPNRLHDRLRYLRSGSSWSIDRLAP